MQLHEASPLQLSTLAALKERRARMAQVKPKPVLTIMPKVEPVAPVIDEPPTKPTEAQKMANWVARQNAMRAWFIEATADDDVNPRPKLRVIKKVVAARFAVRMIDMESKRRTANVVFPRQLAAYLCKTLTLRSLPEIGREFGNRDHTTILHAVRKFTALEADNAEVAAIINEIRAEIAALTAKECVC